MIRYYDYNSWNITKLERSDSDYTRLYYNITDSWAIFTIYQVVLCISQASHHRVPGRSVAVPDDGPSLSPGAWHAWHGPRRRGCAGVREPGGFAWEPWLWPMNNEAPQDIVVDSGIIMELNGYMLDVLWIFWEIFHDRSLLSRTLDSWLVRESFANGLDSG